MDNMIDRMSSDMNILRYRSESDEDYYKRIIYSALGLWGLNCAKRQLEDQSGISKIALTKKLNNLTDVYSSIYPGISGYFHSEESVGLYVRKVYEELGYLIYDQHKLKVAQYGRGLELVENQYLYFGLPNKIEFMSGLGIVSCDVFFMDNITEILIRDNLTPINYVKNSYDLIGFTEWNKNSEGMSYFNPLARCNISNSWQDYPTTEFTVAKDSSNNYYRVICRDNTIKYYLNEGIDAFPEGLFGSDYRRLYYCLKYYYDNPFNVTIKELDKDYSLLNLHGRVPNREQMFLSLVGWPLVSFNNKNSYVIRKEFISVIATCLNKLGIITNEV